MDAERVRKSVLTRHRRDRAVMAVVFLLLFAFSYSEDYVFAILEVAGRDDVAGWLMGLVGFDVAVLTLVGLLKRAIARADGDSPRLWRWWWTAFAAVVCIDVFLVLLPEEHPLWIDLASSAALAIIMGLLMMVSLNGDPLTLVSAARRAEEPDRLGARTRRGSPRNRDIRLLCRLDRFRRLLRPGHRACPRPGIGGRSRRDAVGRATRSVRDSV